MFCVLTPYNFAMEHLEERGKIGILELTMDIIFLIDIFFNFNSAIEN